MNAELIVGLDDLNQVLAQTPFLQQHGFKVSACAAGECTVLVPFQASLERPGGIISGMTIMGVADVAMWLAIMTQRGVDEKWVTSDMKTAFLRSGRESDLICVARILKLGKRSAYGTAECRDSKGELLSHHTLTYAKVGD
jgi:uncharacterized protein (TIGR00369 family)